VGPSAAVLARAEAIKDRIAYARGLKYSPDQPRDERGRFGSGGDGGAAKPVIDRVPGPDEALARMHEVNDLNARLVAEGKDTEHLYAADGSPPPPGLYTAERAAQHAQIIADLMARNADVPAEGKAIVLGGLPGAGKTYAIDHLPEDAKAVIGDIDRSQYITINPDDMKAELQARGMVPDYPGLKGMEASPQIHEESSYLAAQLMAAALENHQNVILDGTLGTTGGTLRKMGALEAAGYQPPIGLYVHVDDSAASQGAIDRFARGMASPDGPRAVAPDFLQQVESGAHFPNRENFDSITPRMGSYVVLDSSDKAAGPKLVASGGSGASVKSFLAAIRKALKFSEDQPRDERGRFGSGGGSPSTTAERLAHGEAVSMKPSAVGPLLDHAATASEPVNLSNVRVEGRSNLFGSEHGVARDQMPVIPSTDPAVIGRFADQLRQAGIPSRYEQVDPRTLSATQGEMDARKVGQMLDTVRNAGGVENHTLVVSRNGDVLDGHHRWAANAAYAMDNPGHTIPVLRADTDIHTLIDEGHKFDANEGIETRQFGKVMHGAILKALIGRADAQKVDFFTDEDGTVRPIRGSDGYSDDGGGGGGGGGGSRSPEPTPPPEHGVESWEESGRGGGEHGMYSVETPDVGTGFIGLKVDASAERVNDDANNKALAERALKQIAALADRYPQVAEEAAAHGGLGIRVLSSTRAGLELGTTIDSRTAAFTLSDSRTGGMFSGDIHVIASGSTWQPGTQQPSLEDINNGTAGVFGTSTEGALTHEFGHLVDYSTSTPSATRAAFSEIVGNQGAPRDASGRQPMDYMSTYGRTNAKEAFAEAFAAYHMTGGQTTNPVVQAYATRFGWKA